MFKNILLKLGVGLALDILIALLTGGGIFAAVMFGMWDDLLLAFVGASLSMPDSLLLSFAWQEFIIARHEMGEEHDMDRQERAWHYLTAVYDHRQHTYSFGHVTPEDREELSILLGVAAFQGRAGDVYEVIVGLFSDPLEDAEILAL